MEIVLQRTFQTIYKDIGTTVGWCHGVMVFWKHLTANGLVLGGEVTSRAYPYPQSIHPQINSLMISARAE